MSHTRQESEDVLADVDKRRIAAEELYRREIANSQRAVHRRSLIKDADRFQKITSGIQAILLTAAVLAGGAWTWYTFETQLSVENAKAQLQKLRSELEREPRLSVSIDLKQFPSQGN